ncbi:uncharacterized protein LOC141784480 [Halichoeres trimaculatus]|uniref:uncharacterized protein LOC141784480 n=1 Tax=Halichoeres trimaculatus TaxID=147232 RepID=UPI003D9F102E
MTSLKLFLCLMCLCWWRTGKLFSLTNRDRLISFVRQEESFVSANVGESVTLRCFFEGNVAAMLYWYKQSLGQKPRLVSSFYKHDTQGTFSEEFENDSRLKLIVNGSINHLMITNVRPSDSATYYCVSSYAYNFQFAEGTTLTVKGSGWIIPTTVHQARSSETLNCAVSAGSCDGEHSVYWVRSSEESKPALVYTQGDRDDQCERKPETNTCVYSLPVESLNSSHARNLYCAVSACGHILFGNESKSNLSDEKNSLDSLVLILSGGLAFTIILAVILTITVYRMNKGGCQCAESQRASDASAAEGYQEADNLHYAALRDPRANRPRAHRDNTRSECVYSRVRQ